MNVNNVLDREKSLFIDDIDTFSKNINDIVSHSKILVLGGAGTIGQAVVKELFERNPIKLHVVDISENNLVELVRDLRSSIGYIEGEFATYALDIDSNEFRKLFFDNGDYDYVFNLSALKHVRSEKDKYTLLRLIKVNILNTIKTMKMAIEIGSKKYFCVSTDKAANPVNLMGASKRIMELFVNEYSKDIDVTMARFANVAFSDGSLPFGFENRMSKKQPLVAPGDVKRYFVTKKESGVICLFAGILGQNRDVFFPKLDEKHLLSFKSILENYLIEKKIKPVFAKSEQEARELVNSVNLDKEWPVYISSSDTTGEKSFEEFYTKNEVLELDRFVDLGVIKNEKDVIFQDELDQFLGELKNLMGRENFEKEEIVNLFKTLLPDLNYQEKGKFLESKM